MKLRFANPYNLIFSLLAFLPVFIFPYAVGLPNTPALIALLLLLLCQIFLNRGHQFSGARDPHGKAMEKMTMEALEKFAPITTRGAHGGLGVTGPTQNIQATESQRAQLLSWLIVFGIWLLSIVGAGDLQNGVAGNINFAAYAPVLTGLAITAAADFLLASRFGARHRKMLIAAALCGLLPVWRLLL